MKKMHTLLTLLFALFFGNKVMALDIPTGLYDVGEEVTTLATGKWYFLYNRGTSKYIKENSSNALKQVTSPKGLSISGNEGYLVTLEDAGDGKYYIKTGLGNYYKAPGSSARGTGATATSSWAIGITAIEGYAGHFILQGPTTYNMVAPNDGSDIKGGTNKTASSIGDWAFIEVKTSSADELTGRDLYNYQMSKLGLIRLHNKRAATAYLTSNASGSATGASKASTGLSQIWILEKSGAAYTMRSANTGQYLQANFAEPSGSAANLYIQFSPNNTGTQAYINISSESNFSGQTCLNLGNDSKTLYKWSYSNDAGSDWAIELVEDVTEQQVRDHMNSAKGYVSELTDGKYYRIVSTAYGLYASETDNDVKSLPLNNGNFAQYWKLTKNGNGYSFQNVLTQNYIQPQTAALSRIYRTATAKATLYPTRTADKWEYKWIIPNANGGSQGMHTSASQGNTVVLWYTDVEASVWAFQEVELSDEDIEAARGERKEYEEQVKNIATYQAALDNLFEDKACTVLKADIQSLSDVQLAANADYAVLPKAMQDMVLKIKNDTWQQYTNSTTGYKAGYEKFFRVADYKIYSNYIEMANGSNFTMSNNFGRLSNPTGIVANANQIVYIYVDDDPKSECSLMLESVSTDGVAGNHSTGSQTTLHKGLNIFSPGQQTMLYIFYQLNNTKKYLADYPDIKIHIEGGELNGYWDATRGMTNADWKLLQQDLLKASPFLNLKTERLVWQMDANLVLAAEPNEIEGVTNIWNTICANEDRYMGVEDFEGRYNNIWNVFSGASSYMHSSAFGTWYTESTISTVMNYANMRKAGSIWGPSHEIGHNHQGSINVIGTTESSNNLFSNINTFEQGIQTTRRQVPNDSFYEFAKGTPWLGRNIWNTTSMFFQLYLYFHAMHHDDQFYPNLYRAMRKSPINKWSGPGGSGPTSYGKDDYLHLAKKICDVAQADLSEFFESYGMFVPVDKYEVGDYSTYFVTTTQADIDAAKAYMKKYPKKLGNIMFIDDHITPMKDADPDNIFDAIPASNGKKTNNLDQHNELSNGQPAGSAGDYEDYDGDPAYKVTGDYYTITGTTVSFKGSNFMGHKFYDKQGKLIWATNGKSSPLPSALTSLTPDVDYFVVAAEANMEDVPCPLYRSGSLKVYKQEVYFGNEDESVIWWANANTTLGDYLPENAIAVVGTAEAPENITNTTNVVDMDGTAQSIVLNGDKPAFIPQDIEAQSIRFQKSISGYAALDLPFDVTSSEVSGLKTLTYEGNVLNVTDAESVAAGQPVVVNGNVDITRSNVTVKAGNYQELSIVKVLGEDGNSAIEVESASPFTFSLGEATAVEAINIEKNNSESNSIYDLSGRRIDRITKAGIYIVNGKKVVIK